MVEYRRIKSQPPAQVEAEPDAKLRRAEIVRQVRPLIISETPLLVETGDSWFNGMMMKLPNGARFEIEMQWGHIGWSVPAAFAHALVAPGRRIITMIGDGSFQLTAQQVAQMILQRLPVIIFLIDSHGYTIEIHDGPYNTIKNWDYAGLIQVFNAEDGKGRGLRATNSGELAEAINVALANQVGPTLIERVIDRDDCTSHLISWDRLVATANARPPRPHSALPCTQHGGPRLPAPVVRSCGEYAMRSASRKAGRFICQCPFGASSLAFEGSKITATAEGNVDVWEKVE
jgi:pyruvate decarboxylase